MAPAPFIMTCQPGYGPQGLNRKPIPGEAIPDVYGERLTMSDGSVWFHPADGSAPTQEKA